MKPDPLGLSRLFAESRPRLLALVEQRVRHTALQARVDPEDVLGDAWFKASKRWPEYQQQPALDPFLWLYGIVLDCWRDTYRAHKAACRDVGRDERFPEESSVQLVQRLIDSGSSPSAAASRAEQQEQLRRVLGLLPEEDRVLLSMRYLDQLSWQEVAGHLGITANAAMVRHSRALTRLLRHGAALGLDEGATG
jgi:RNA polymerase sigma-70 factor (ECF subfamily)